MDTSCLATTMPIFEGRAFQPVFLPLHPQASYLQQLGDLNERAVNRSAELQVDLENNSGAVKDGFVPVNTVQEMKE